MRGSVPIGQQNCSLCVDNLAAYEVTIVTNSYSQDKRESIALVCPPCFESRLEKIRHDLDVRLYDRDDDIAFLGSVVGFEVKCLIAMTRFVGGGVR